MNHRYRITEKQSGAVGILSVILVTTLVLIFMLTISVQILLNVKNAKLLTDFNRIYYSVEGGLRDARLQLTREETLDKIFQPLVVGDSTVTRTSTIGLATTTINVQGGSVSIMRQFISECLNGLTGCLLHETP